MNLKKSTGLFWFMAANLSVSLVLMIVNANGFDLNEIPNDGGLSELGSTTPKFVQNPTMATTRQTSSKGPERRKVAKGRRKVSPAFYDKIMKLLDVLKICDREDFDISTMVIPESFSTENRAMMALNEVSKANLIEKKDEARFNRVMKNCLELFKVIQKNTEGNMSIDSEMSGGTYEDRIARLKESPLDNLKDRFLKPSQAKSSKAEDKYPTNSRTHNQRSLSPTVSSVNSIGSNQRDQVQKKPMNLIQFF